MFVCQSLKMPPGCAGGAGACPGADGGGAPCAVALPAGRSRVSLTLLLTVFPPEGLWLVCQSCCQCPSSAMAGCGLQLALQKTECLYPELWI